MSLLLNQKYIPQVTSVSMHVLKLLKSFYYPVTEKRTIKYHVWNQEVLFLKKNIKKREFIFRIKEKKFSE